MSDDGIVFLFLSFIVGLLFGLGLGLYKAFEWTTDWSDDKRAIAGFLIAGVIVKGLIVTISILGYRDMKRGAL